MIYQPIPTTDKPSSQQPYVDQHQNQAQYAPQQPYQQQQAAYNTAQHPYAQPVYASVVYMQPPRRSAVQRYVSRFGHALLLVLLNIVNLVFSIAMFAAVMIGLSLSVGLLPVACLGLVVLNLFICFIRPIAALDGWLYSLRQRAYESLTDEN
ncbi:hypothetical protein H257_14866 [Aphanomyces astaci]|uniref:Uncharacterized protein n=1 Tax=Aphanomyces astaci TaxID=112090 RepID=W4FPW2_APHAT|nr:hypothetical protein H257_14866 [Aphanomyces astaci]ETV69500.1 hypothetical protein H257_14866 [Aphanomyces astaci]RQM22910.1 hypothetical protein B5M09_006257 [Aphanomyces astaci]|eukprot:XP_009841073.1 hypothetical protein H257_14866 [Aphanomyces astaci]